MNGTNPNMLKKLSVEDVREMRKMRAEGMNPKLLSKVFNVCITTVQWHTDSFAPERNLDNYPNKPMDY